MKKIAIILNIQSSRNPVLLHCLRNLQDLFEITVISPDQFEDHYKFQNVTFLNCFEYLKWSGRVLRIFNIVIKYLSIAIEFFPKLFNRNFQFNIFRNFGTILEFSIVHSLLLPYLYSQKLSKIEKLSGIICIDAGALTAARRIKKLKQTPFAYWAYEIYPNQFVDTPNLLRRLMEKIEGNGCRNADLAIVTSDIWAKFLRRRYKAYGLKHQIVCVCPPPVKKYADLELSGKIKFYYHGAYIPGRGLENLIQAMRSVNGGILYLRGISNDFEKFLKEETNRLNLNDKVKFLPAVPTEQLAEEATKFDVGVMIVCMTTLNAKFLIGFKTFENISAGLPLFSPKSYQLKEIINEHKVGIIFPDCSENALAATLNYCVSNKEKIREWKLNARKYAEKEINPEYQHRQLLEAINKLSNKTQILSK